MRLAIAKRPKIVIWFNQGRDNMDQISDILLTDMRHVITSLGKQGGVMSASVYDTAQVARLAPASENVWPALEWLLDQQQSDGGWGNPTVPLARDVPTLAAVLALKAIGTRKAMRVATQEGINFLRRQATKWLKSLPDELPVGVELLLPMLLEEAKKVDIDLPYDMYVSVYNLGKKRRKLIASLKLRPGNTPVHSWEAFGTSPEHEMLDVFGSVGHSPAATAAWLHLAENQRAHSVGHSPAMAAKVHLAENQKQLTDDTQRARSYLEQAAAATGVGIPGVVPTIWPMNRFEQSNALYALLIGGLLDHPHLRSVIEPQLDDMARAVRPTGLGLSDAFDPDGDDTAEALALLVATGRASDAQALYGFAFQKHFVAYPGEMQPSPSVTAHGIHTLALCKHDTREAQAYLLERQLPDGRWLGDKWNGSWLYTTCQALVGLNEAADPASDKHIEQAVHTILSYQQPDGGWGDDGSTAEETAYAVLALRAMRGRFTVEEQLKTGQRWLLNQYRPFHAERQPIWLGKEVYCPQRLSRIMELAAMFPLA
jgi:hypothetical protein